MIGVRVGVWRGGVGERKEEGSEERGEEQGEGREGGKGEARVFAFSALVCSWPVNCSWRFVSIGLRLDGGFGRLVIRVIFTALIPAMVSFCSQRTDSKDSLNPGIPTIWSICSKLIPRIHSFS